MIPYISTIFAGASIIGLVEEPVDTLEKSLALLERGTLLRSVGTTAMNNGSSRSHALIFLKVKVRYFDVFLVCRSYKLFIQQRIQLKSKFKQKACSVIDAPNTLQISKDILNQDCHKNLYVGFA